MDFKKLTFDDVDKLTNKQLLDWGRDMYRRMARSGKSKPSLSEFHTLVLRVKNCCPWCELAYREFKNDIDYIHPCQYCVINWPINGSNEIRCDRGGGLWQIWDSTSCPKEARVLAKQISKLPLKPEYEEIYGN